MILHDYPYFYLAEFSRIKCKPYRNKPELMPLKAQGRNEKCKCGSGKKI